MLTSWFSDHKDARGNAAESFYQAPAAAASVAPTAAPASVPAAVQPLALNFERILAPASLYEATAAIGVLHQRLHDIAAAFGVKQDKVATFDGAAVRADLESRIAWMAAEQLAQLGFPAARLPVAPSGADESKTVAYSEWKQMGAKERAAFMRDGGKIDGGPELQRIAAR